MTNSCFSVGGLVWLRQSQLPSWQLVRAVLDLFWNTGMLWPTAPAQHQGRAGGARGAGDAARTGDPSDHDILFRNKTGGRLRGGCAWDPAGPRPVCHAQPFSLDSLVFVWLLFCYLFFLLFSYYYYYFKSLSCFYLGPVLPSLSPFWFSARPAERGAE